MALPTVTVTPGTGQTINTLPNGGQAAGASSLPVVIASDQSAVPTAQILPATSAATSVAASISPTVILASNTSRRRYSVYNDSTSIAYILENSGTVSTTNYSYQLAAGAYFSSTEWNGAVNALWATAAGNARVMEYTP